MQTATQKTGLLIATLMACAFGHSHDESLPAEINGRYEEVGRKLSTIIEKADELAKSERSLRASLASGFDLALSEKLKKIEPQLMQLVQGEVDIRGELDAAIKAHANHLHSIRSDAVAREAALREEIIGRIAKIGFDGSKLAEERFERRDQHGIMRKVRIEEVLLDMHPAMHVARTAVRLSDSRIALLLESKHSNYVKNNARVALLKNTLRDFAESV